VKWERAALAYYNNYLIDTPRRVIHHLRDGGGVRGPRSRRWSRGWSSAFVGLHRTPTTGGMSHDEAILAFVA
jgi:hypothetical protein